MSIYTSLLIEPKRQQQMCLHLEIRNQRMLSSREWPLQQCALQSKVHSSLCYKHRTATGTHVPYGITQCYLPPGRGDIPAFTPAN